MQDAHPHEPTSKPSFFERGFNAFVIGVMTLAVLVVLIPLLPDLLRTTESTSRVPKRPPFEARYADLVLHIPDRPDLYKATKHEFGLIVRICDRSVTEKAPAGCEALSEPLVNRSGIWIREGTSHRHKVQVDQGASAGRCFAWSLAHDPRSGNAD